MAQQPAGSALQSILNAAVAAHQAGDVAAAVSGYRRVLAAMPKHAPTLHLMGVALTQSGDAEGGVRSIKSAIKLAPRDPVFHFNLANAERAAGRDSRALAALEAAIARKPDYAEAHLNRANLLERAGRVEEAERAYRAATQYAPDWPLPRINLTLLLARTGKVTAALELAASLPRNGPGLNASGVALRAAGRLDEAEAAFRAALSQNAADRDARGNLGAVLLEGGALDEAEPLLESAAADGGPVEARANLARLYFKRSRTRDALALLDAVIAERPTDPALLAQRAVLREMISDEAGAQADVDAGLALKPGHPELTYVAALLHLREGAAEAALNLLDSLDSDSLTEGTLALQAAFERARALDRLNRTEDALTAFTEANRRAKAVHGATADPAPNTALLDRLEAFDPARTAIAPLPEDGIEDPVFLIGFPRSGTTLLDRMLDGHGGLKVMEEEPILDGLAARLAERPEGYPEALAVLNVEDRLALRRQYAEWAAAKGPQGPGRLIDKLPLNAIHVPLIRSLFPRARFILALRHPMDSVLSCFMQNFHMNAAMANYLTLDGAAHHYDRVMGLCQVACTALEIAPIRVRYEDLIDDPEDVAGKVIGALGLEWDEAVLDHAGRAKGRRINTPSYAQVSEPVYKRAAGRWQRYEAALKPLEPVLAPWIDRWGYSAG